MLQQFGINSTIIQAPMAGVTTPSFVAASCEAGALGFIAAGYLNKEELISFIQNVKTKTRRPFGVNVFIQDEPRPDKQTLIEAKAALQPIYDELSITTEPSFTFENHFSEQLEAILTENIRVVSFTFGLPSKEMIQRLKENNVFLMATATTKDEALAVATAGFDAVILQGREAGGHRGSFIQPTEFIPLEELITQVQGTISIPIIAAGGLMTREQISKALALGADAVQIGTALLVADECEIPPAYKQAILDSREGSTGMITAFTGKPARGLLNDFSHRLQNAVIAPYPYQHLLTLAIRERNTQDYAFYLMGEHSFQAKQGTLKEIISELTGQTQT